MMITLPPKITLLGNSTQPLAISPDGSTIVYSAIDENQKTQFYLRKLNSFESTPIPGSENGMGPFFSPDGEWVGFVTPDDKLKKVSLRGSSSILADPAISIGATWADNGTIYFIKTFASGIYAIPAGGGEATQVTHTGTKADDRVHLWPSVLPRNSGLIFTVWSGKSFNEARIEGISFKTGKRKVLLENGTDAHYLSSGHIAHGRDGTLFIAGFDPDRMEVKSSPTLVSTSTQGTFLMSPKTLTQNPLDDRAGMPVNKRLRPRPRQSNFRPR
jgi:eukaryotic-like serine/threonine-protein kinase